MIQKVAVLGSGVMGSGIAAHIANAGIPVVLLDIVPEGATNRRILTENAVAKQLAATPSGFTHPTNAARVTCGNLEDDLALLADVDLIIEAVLERLDIKQTIYHKIDAVRKKGSIVASNTSTLPLHVLVEGLSPAFAEDFLITHFFNPPRFMTLLEVVASPRTRKDAYEAVKAFADVTLGKGIVECKDTPGFIANRIGVFFMAVGVAEAERLGIAIEDADAVMSKPVGIPKTGVFGLLDLIGIDLMPLMAKGLLGTLPEQDMFRTSYRDSPRLAAMIAAGYTGRKGKGGFYRINKDSGKKVTEVIQLVSGEYRAQQAPSLASAKTAKTLADVMNHADLGGQYARAVLGKTLAYAASLIPEIADDIVAVDNTMKWGYNWKFGPFEMISQLGVARINEILAELNIPIPPYLVTAGTRPLYQAQDYLTLAGSYAPLPTKEGVWSVADKKRGQTPIAKDAGIALIDIGDGIACLEFSSKMNALDPVMLTFIERHISTVANEFKGLVIGSDSAAFSAGANLSLFLETAKRGDYAAIAGMIEQGQRSMLALKYAPFPVVAALGGLALGGGCEIVLHADAVQAHIESTPGLVEVNVGLIPGWGGCKELLIRHAQKDAASAFAASFALISRAKTAESADIARDILLLNAKSRISMNRARLIPDAKSLCLDLAKNYQPPAPPAISIPSEAAKQAVLKQIELAVEAGTLSAHDRIIQTHLVEILASSDTPSEQDVMDREKAAFLALIALPATHARIEHILTTGKPLKN